MLDLRGIYSYEAHPFLIFQLYGIAIDYFCYEYITVIAFFTERPGKFKIPFVMNFTFGICYKTRGKKYQKNR